MEDPNLSVAKFELRCNLLYANCLVFRVYAMPDPFL